MQVILVGQDPRIRSSGSFLTYLTIKRQRTNPNSASSSAVVMFFGCYHRATSRPTDRRASKYISNFQQRSPSGGRTGLRTGSRGHLWRGRNGEWDRTRLPVHVAGIT